MEWDGDEGSTSLGDDGGMDGSSFKCTRFSPVCKQYPTRSYICIARRLASTPTILTIHVCFIANPSAPYCTATGRSNCELIPSKFCAETDP